jgi:hypothetical protein
MGGVASGGTGTSGGGTSGGAAGSSTGGAASGGTPSTPPPFSGPAVTLIRDAAACTSGTLSVGRTPLRRLSRVEYNSMVRDLLGDDTKPALGFVSEEKVVGFNSNSYTPVNATINRQYLEAAEKLAEATVTNRMSTVFACGATPADSCIQQSIESFAKRAFRGQLEDAQKAALLELYSATKTQFDVPTAMQAVITAVLTSPRFLFVLEFGQTGVSPGPGGAVPLTSWEVAARLALYLWRSVPDQTLSQAADAGMLSTPDQLEAQATRMLADGKAKAALADFADQWLDIESMDAVTKDTQFQAVWSPKVAKALHTETLTTFTQAVLADDASFMQLLTSSTSYLNTDLAQYYGVSVSSSEFTKTNPNPTPAAPIRAGILTQGAFLATHAHTTLGSPVLRGKILRASLFCSPTPPPSSIKDLVIPPAPNQVTAGKTTRDLAFAHSQKESRCIGCHIGMDNLGFAMGYYDAAGMPFAKNAAGKFVENDQVIDATGQFTNVAPDLDGKPFDGALDMVQQMAASDQVRACFAVEQFRYALSRVETSADACSLQAANTAFSGANFNLKKLVLAMVRTDAFRHRTVITPGSACQ